MSHDGWTDRLSEYLDDELTEEERQQLESHLQTCHDCTVVLGDLRRVVRRARILGEQRPPRDLWPEIASRIGASLPTSRDVLDLSTRRRGPRRWTFSLPQLAAAGIALMTLSGGAAWLLSSPADAPVPTQAISVPSGESLAVTVALRDNTSDSYAAAVADLERILAEGRGRLDTTTVRVIEQNLAAIDRAIAEAQRALRADSANLYLNTHLAETMRRKLDLLRQAAALVPVS
jgi:predicted anti-sigma-YlaC factor YlaD